MLVPNKMVRMLEQNRMGLAPHMKPQLPGQHRMVLALELEHQKWVFESLDPCGLLVLSVLSAL